MTITVFVWLVNFPDLPQIRLCPEGIPAVAFYRPDILPLAQLTAPEVKYILAFFVGYWQ